MLLARIGMVALLQVAMNTALAAEAPACAARAPAVQRTIQLPSGVVGRPYARLLIQGGEPPYRLAFEAATPDEIGLSVNPDGRLVGVPARPGLHRFTVSVLDGEGRVLTTQAYQIRVLPRADGP